MARASLHVFRDWPLVESLLGDHHIIPNGTKIRCSFQGCQRIRHFNNGLKIQYECRWLVVDGPHTGTVVVRNLWESEGGRTQLRLDCDKLDLAHPEELCTFQHAPILIEGTACIKDAPGGPRNELAYIARRLSIEAEAPVQADSDPVYDAF